MKQILHFKSLLLATLFTGALTMASAQETNIEKLARANELYEKGQFNACTELVQSCNLEDATVSEQWQGYRLLSLTYLATQQDAQARQSVEKMIALNPTYQPSTVKDPPELVRLIQSVNVIPKFSLGVAVTVGGNYSYPQVTGTYNVYSYTKTYNPEASWQAGIMTGYHLNKVISLNAMLIASGKNYNLSYDIPDWKMSVSERLTYLDLPVFARFVINPRNKLRVFADAGGYTGYLLNAEKDFQRTYTPDGENTSLENLNVTGQRNRWEYGLVGGGGLMYEIGTLTVALDLKYYYSFANITNPDERYSNPTALYQYLYIDDDVRIHNLSVSISFIHHMNYQILTKHSAL